ncbi:MAG: serine hydrolase domain-containing protein [Saprospiraceae bacterium]
MKSLATTLFFTIFCFGLSGQNKLQAPLDSLFEVLGRNKQIMGSLSLYENDEEIYFNSTGFARLKSRQKPGPETTYRIGSITKTFTAVVIMQLIEEDRLQINDKLAQFFPKIPYAGQITIESMLRHHSGLSDPDFLQWKYKGKSFKLRKKAVYANTNYVLLAEIAEQLEDKPFAQILHERVFEPCSLNHSHYGEKSDSLPPHEAFSYRWKNGWQRVSPSDLSQPHGAGSIIATPGDVNRFYAHLFSGKLLSEKSLNEMKTTVDGIGIGLMPMQFNTRKAFGHSGRIDGFESTIAYFPDSHFSICYISNGVALPINDVLVAVLRTVWGD